MIDIIKNVAKVFLNRNPSGQNISIFSEDTFIVSYPRSGNTWARFLIGNLMNKEPVTFANIEKKVPDIHRNNDKELLCIPSPRILKSHECFDHRYKNVIYIVRDPRDVVISYYHFQIKTKAILESYPIDQFVSQFIDGELDSFGSWGENVGSWLGAKQYCNRFLMIRYEDMLENPVFELQKITSFLGINRSEEQLMRANELSSFKNMRKSEIRDSDRWKPLSKSRKDKFFVRSANKGAWKTELSDSSAKRIEMAWHNTMSLLRYY
ncbi:sulfotransferase domain-containing protein [Thermodesulfobacteriota bacterium]